MQFCKDLPDSLIHIYATRRITKDFWNQVIQFINGIFEHPISLNITEIIFGTFLHESSLVLFLVLLAKYFIHCCYWTKKLPYINVYLSKIEMYENIERLQAFKQDNLRFHETK